MSLLGLLIIAIVVGAALYLVNLLPLDPTFKAIIRVVAIVIFIIYVLMFLFGQAGLFRGVF